MHNLQQAVAQLADLMLGSSKTVVLTGAGISTESGIPDFRSPGGLWSKIDPIFAFSAETFIKRPRVFYDMGLPHLSSITEARPNRAHEVLAGLEKARLVDTVITQNVDSLHQKAGSANVLEVHGHLRSATCMKCGAVISWSALVEQVTAREIPPRCDHGGCGGIYKPDCVFFGDNMTDDYHVAAHASATSDLFLVIGSSLEVSPVNYLPLQANKLAIINLGPTLADNHAALMVRGRAGEALDLLWQTLGHRGAV